MRDQRAWGADWGVARESVGGDMTEVLTLMAKERGDAVRSSYVGVTA